MSTALEEPVIYPTDPLNRSRLRFATQVQTAAKATTRADTLRVAVMGDSTATSPGGFGVALHHALISLLGRMYGNIPATPAGTFVGGTGPLMNFSNTNQKSLQGSFDSTYYPMGFTPRALPWITGEGSYQPGCALQIAGTFASHQLRKYVVDTPLFDQSAMQLEVVALKQAGSTPGIRVYWAPNPSGGYSLFSTKVSFDDLLPPRITEDNGGVIELCESVYSSPVANASETTVPQWYLNASEATTESTGAGYPPAFSHVRIWGADPKGAVVDFIGAGGYATNTVIGASSGGAGNHENCIPYLAQLGYDVIFCAFTNDVYSVWTAEQQANNYYDPDGSSNRGLLGELIAECEARGIAVPTFVFVTPPFRDKWASWTSAMRVQHELMPEAFAALVDRMQADGHHALALNNFRYCWERGFTERASTLDGLTSRGAYSTSGVSYAVNDYYSHTDGTLWRCKYAHTSTVNTEITDSVVQHAPLREFLSDNVHRSAAGGALEAEGYAEMFAAHALNVRTDEVTRLLERTLGSAAEKWPSDYR